MNFKKVAPLAFVFFIFSCSQSQNEKNDIAKLTCNIIGESRNMDGAMRIKEINTAREKIGESMFLGSDEYIKEMYDEGLCKKLVLNTHESHLADIEADRLRALEKAKKELEELKNKNKKELEELKNKKEISMKNTLSINTTMGIITVALDAEKAPVTVKNFVSIANSGYFEGTIFHRVINGFMVQGGGLNADMSDKSSGTAPIQNEANNGLSNDRGTIAMARTMDPHSATSQFFINHKDNGFLNHTGENQQGWGYAVFGKVIHGMDVVDAIANVATGSTGGHQDVPLEVIIIESVTIAE
jgi:peptidyl-prolyl cis-trans isomerase B (cyclophilin B)